VIALDTNLLVRLLLRDDEAQYAKVVGLLNTDDLFTAPVTVFLELVWVLEAHDCKPQEIEAGLSLLLGLTNFKPPHAQVIRAALAAYAKGVDFADALHVSMSAGDPAFKTLHKRFVRKAAALGLLPPVLAI
jgi:predicted nucleic-acid-binding protein